MIALAQRLDREGHDVLIAGPPDYVTAAERRRLRYHAYGSAIDNFLADTAADYAGGSRRSHRALNRAIEMARPSSTAATRQSTSGSAQPGRLMPARPRGSWSRRSGSLDVAA